MFILVSRLFEPHNPPVNVVEESTYFLWEYLCLETSKDQPIMKTKPVEDWENGRFQ